MPIHTISPIHPFLATLAKGIKQRISADPAVVSTMHILLPNRRACVTFRQLLLAELDCQAMILPKLQAIGDVENDAAMLSAKATLLEGDNTNSSKVVVPRLRQQLLLTKLVQQWLHSKEGAMPDMASCLALADELIVFLDALEREQCEPSKLRDIVPSQFASHWQESLQFLQIITEHWPQIAAEQGWITPIAYRNYIHQLQQRLWQHEPPDYPVIAAGSTGSIKATAGLLAAVQALPQGHVILPGLDTSLDPAIVDATHPQYGMQQWLRSVEVTPNKVDEWCQDAAKQSPASRLHNLHQVLLPAEQTYSWQQHETLPALDNVALVDTANIHEMSQVIAVAIREALGQEEQERTIALVTTDRELARRVAIALQKWDIIPNDSSGAALLHSPLAIYLLLLVEAVQAEFAPSNLLALLKHPLTAQAMPREEWLANVAMLEQLALRGLKLAPGLEPISQMLAAQGANRDLRNWWHDIVATLEPLTKTMKEPYAFINTTIKQHMRCAEALHALGGSGDNVSLWQGDAAETICQCFEELASHSGVLGKVAKHDYTAMLNTVLRRQSYFPQDDFHPNVHIMDPMEARLQPFDCVILADMNENAWPPSINQSPWVNRAMQETLGLPLPERHIGLVARDFVEFACAKEVILVRAKKRDGVASVASRWWQRLRMLGAHYGWQCLHAKTYLKDWAAELFNNLDIDVTPFAPPQAKPPVEVRPTTLSATQVETLLQNPYKFYAQKILRLRELDPIEKDAGGAEFGTFIHNLWEFYANAYDANQSEEEQLQNLQTHADRLLGDMRAPQYLIKLWQPRLDRIFAWIVATERERRQNVVEVFAEQVGHYDIKLNDVTYTIKATADRIEWDNEGLLHVIDYKTTMLPTQKALKMGLAPQLPIEALIAANDGFGATGEVAEVVFWKVTGATEIAEMKVAVAEKSIEDTIEVTEDGLAKIFNAYSDPDIAYIANQDPEKMGYYDPYVHLARLKEGRP